MYYRYNKSPDMDAQWCPMSLLGTFGHFESSSLNFEMLCLGIFLNWVGHVSELAWAFFWAYSIFWAFQREDHKYFTNLMSHPLPPGFQYVHMRYKIKKRHRQGHIYSAFHKWNQHIEHFNDFFLWNEPRVLK